MEIILAVWLGLTTKAMNWHWHVSLKVVGAQINAFSSVALYWLLFELGKPRPSLIWWRDYAIIDDSFEYDDPDGKRGILSIETFIYLNNFFSL